MPFCLAGLFRIVWHFLPKFWFGIFLVSFIFQHAEIETQLSQPIANVTLIFLFLSVSIVIHELGHLMMAWLVGGRPEQMILGSGREVYRGKIYSLNIHVRENARGGFSFASFDSASIPRWKHAAFSSGGILANLLVAIATHTLFGLDLTFLRAGASLDLATPIILANAFTALINLTPYYSNVSGTKHPTDGLVLLTLPFRSVF
jgi:membrane-associated protease RseP (regulator of RpoE activity)